MCVDALAKQSETIA